MKSHRMTYCLIVVGVLVGCAHQFASADYSAAVQSARMGVPCAVQMEHLFGEVDHFFNNYRSHSAVKTWNTEAHFGGRYCLTMQVEISVDYATNTISQVGEPTFYFKEVTEVDREGHGLYGATFRGLHKEFGQDEWKRLFESDGDWTTIGVKLNSKPVPLFAEYVAAVRKDRERVTLLDKKDTSGKAVPPPADGRRNDVQPKSE